MKPIAIIWAGIPIVRQISFNKTGIPPDHKETSNMKKHVLVIPASPLTVLPAFATAADTRCDSYTHKEWCTCGTTGLDIPAGSSRNNWFNKI